MQLLLAVAAVASVDGGGGLWCHRRGGERERGIMVRVRVLKF